MERPRPILGKTSEDLVGRGPAGEAFVGTDVCARPRAEIDHAVTGVLHDLPRTCACAVGRTQNVPLSEQLHPPKSVATRAGSIVVEGARWSPARAKPTTVQCQGVRPHA